MSKLIPPPPPTVPIGRVNARGDVIINQDWALYLTVGLLQRLGGYNAPDINDLSTRAYQVSWDDGDSNDMMMIPGPAGAAGPRGESGVVVMQDADYVEPDDLRPPGAQPVWGRYTPTLTNVANLDASTAYECVFAQVGMAVIVSGRVDVNPTAAGLVQLGISLPLPSNLSSVTHLSGSAAASAVAGQSAAVLPDLANNRASLEFTAVDLANRAMFFTFMYQVFS